MTKNTAPHQPTADDLPNTAVRERTSVTNIRMAGQAALAAYAEDDMEPQEPQTPQEPWEKRYADLRRHAQKQVNEKDKQLKDLQDTVVQLQNSLNQPMPRTKQELEEWKIKYPDIAAIMEALIDERATIKSQSLQTKLGEVESRLATAEEQRAYAQLKALVPDLEDVLRTSEWKSWFSEFPDSVQQQINKSDDPLEVAKMIKKFKATQGKGASAPAQPERPDRTSVLDAAVRNSGVAPQQRQQAYQFTALQIKAMGAKEFEKNEEAIDEARRKGLVLDDTQRKVYHTDYR